MSLSTFWAIELESTSLMLSWWMILWSPVRMACLMMLLGELSKKACSAWWYWSWLWIICPTRDWTWAMMPWLANLMWKSICPLLLRGKLGDKNLPLMGECLFNLLLVSLLSKLSLSITAWWCLLIWFASGAERFALSGLLIGK